MAAQRGVTAATRQESLKVSEVGSWLFATGTKQLTVYDQDGMLRDECQVIAKEIVRRLTEGFGKEVEIIPAGDSAASVISLKVKG